jgi:ketosteroid isomerase-like protein
VWIYELSGGMLTRARFYGDTAAVRDAFDGFIPED